MRPPEPLNERERELIYQGRTQGKTMIEVANELQRSLMSVRKWWRRIRDEGIQGLQTRPRGTKVKGALSRYPAKTAETAFEMKRKHPGQGADHILAAMQAKAEFSPGELPGRSRLSAFFKERCPELLRKPGKKRPSQAVPVKSTAAHEVWQLDSQEKVELTDGSLATVCNIRDPFGAAMIASRAFSTKTEKRWRKLTWPEIRQVLRGAFTEWRTLPDCVQTDNELILVGNPGDPYPSQLALWLVGLGIKFQTIRPHRPTDQAQVERNHRTLDEATFDQEGLASLENFQAALDQERHLYNHFFPSRASDCQARAPLEAHPALLRPRRPYRPDDELFLFDLQRVYDYLATFTFERTASASGTVGLEAHQCSIGRCHAGKAVQVCCDPTHREWVFYEPLPNGHGHREQEFLRRPVKYLRVIVLTGLESVPPNHPEPIQLGLPCLI